MAKHEHEGHLHGGHMLKHGGKHGGKMGKGAKPGMVKTPMMTGKAAPGKA